MQQLLHVCFYKLQILGSAPSSNNSNSMYLYFSILKARVRGVSPQPALRFISFTSNLTILGLSRPKRIGDQPLAFCFLISAPYFMRHSTIDTLCISIVTF